MSTAIALAVNWSGYNWLELLPYLLWTNLFYFLGRYIDPDLDIMSFTAADNRMIRELGPLGLIFSAYWTLYAWLMFAIVWLTGRAHPKYGAHRSYLTHTFIPGTIIRIVFFNIPIWASIKGLEYVSSTPIMASMFLPTIPYVVGQIIGLGLADILHIYLDKTRKYNDYSPYAPRK